jgi:hypothetical protein
MSALGDEGASCATREGRWSTCCLESSRSVRDHAINMTCDSQKSSKVVADEYCCAAESRVQELRWRESAGRRVGGRVGGGGVVPRLSDNTDAKIEALNDIEPPRAPRAIPVESG